jgi:phage tail sheath gpL-like
VSGYIDEVVDVTSDAVNETLTPGGEFIISGDKLKIAGDNADVGLYFVSAADATQRVKVTGRMAENAPAKLIGIIPALAAGAWKVQVVTQYAGSGTITLKAPRTIESKVEFTVA